MTNLPRHPQTYPPPPAAPPPVQSTKRSTPPWLGLAGAVVVAIGSVGPWATATAPFVGTFSMSGIEGDGVLFLGAALVAALALLGRGAWILFAMICGIVMTGAAVYELIHVNDVVADVGGTPIVSASIGWGLWLVLVGSVVIAAGAISVFDSDQYES